MKKVYQYDIDGNFIQEFESTTVASKTLGMKREGISRVARGCALLNLGYRWSFIKYDKLPPLSSFDKYDIIEGEVWKPIQGFSHYFVSNKGRIRSTTYVSNGNKNKVEYGKVYSVSTDTSGYKMVDLIGDDGKRNLFRIHRLVATAFIENPDNLPIINHKNRNAGDNRVENLEWCTPSYNATYLDAVELRSKKIKKWYVQLDLNGNVVNIHNGLEEARMSVDGTRFLISACCSGKKESHKGFKWAYLESFPEEEQKALKSKYYEKK